MQDDLFEWAARKTVIDATKIFRERALEALVQNLVNHALGNRPVRRDGRIIQLPRPEKAA